MTLDLDIKFLQTEYKENEINIIKDIFGLVCRNVYFNLSVHEHIPKKHKFINFNGISGTGKTVIKDHIKEVLQNEEKYVIDFDDEDDFIEKYGDNNILEVFNITKHDDELLKIISYFGLFEMRILMTPIKKLSMGQQTRLKYIRLFYKVKEGETSHILIDEFLTFVDEITSLNFARAIRKFLKDKDIKLYTFGVNSSLLGQFEDISYILGNSCINAVVEDGIVKYKHEKDTTLLNEWS